MSEKNSTQDISDKREVVLEMSQEKYDEMKERGIDEEAIPKVGKHTFRRRTRKLDPREAKIKMTMFIDYDVLQYFKNRAEKSDIEDFHTQINRELREIMESDLAIEKENLNKVAEKLVNNSAFIDAISEKLKAA